MAGNDLNLSLILRMTDRASAPLRRFNGRLLALQAPVRRLGGELSRAMALSGVNRLSSGVAGLGRQITGLTFKLTALAGAVGFVFKNQFIDTAAEFENLTVSLTAVEGSAERGQKALAWITDFTKKTPLELNTTTKAYMLLKNSGIDPTNGSLMSLVDANAKLNGDQENMIEITRQLGQAWMKNKLQMEEINVLTTRGVKVVPLLAEAMGKSEQVIMDMASKGRLGRQELILLFRAMQEDSRGASEAQSRTWTGMMSTLSDTWKGFIRRIMDGGAFDLLKARLDGLIKRLEFFETAGGQAQVDLWAGRLTQFLRDIETFAGAAWVKIKQLADQVGGFGNLAKIALGAVAAIMAGPLLLAITNVVAGVAMLTAAFAANPILLAIVAIGAAIALVVTHWDDLTAAFFAGAKDIGKWLTEGVLSAVHAVVEGITGIGRAIKNIFSFKNPFAGGDKLFPYPDAPAKAPALALGNKVPVLSDSGARPGSKAEVGGKIQLEVIGPARVRNVQSNNPAVDFNVDAGLSMMGAR